jgi:hypothetical protein
MSGTKLDQTVKNWVAPGIPLVFERDEQLKPIMHYYLGDPKAGAKAEQTITSQEKAR